MAAGTAARRKKLAMPKKLKCERKHHRRIEDWRGCLAYPSGAEDTERKKLAMPKKLKCERKHHRQIEDWRGCLAYPSGAEDTEIFLKMRALTRTAGA
jgi:hypothetical protein